MLVTCTPNRNLSPSAGNLLLSSVAPSLAGTNISPAAGNLVLSTFAPTVDAGGFPNNNSGSPEIVVVL